MEGISEDGVVMILVVHAPRSPTGLTRAELVWVLALLTGVLALILGTHQREMRLAKERHAGDMLQHMAGMISLALPDAQENGPWAGPGDRPQDWKEVIDLAGLANIPDLPPDPWGGAYRLQRQPEGSLILSCSNAAVPALTVPAVP